MSPRRITKPAVISKAETAGTTPKPAKAPKPPRFSLAVRADYIRMAAPFASTEPVRCYLNGVAVTARPDGNGVDIVATDGHRMAIFHDAAGHLEGVPVVLVSLTRDRLKACDSRRLKVSDRPFDAWLVIDSRDGTVIPQGDVVVEAADGPKVPPRVIYHPALVRLFLDANRAEGAAAALRAYRRRARVIGGEEVGQPWKDQHIDPTVLYPDWRKVVPTPKSLRAPMLRSGAPSFFSGYVGDFIPIAESGDTAGAFLKNPRTRGAITIFPTSQDGPALVRAGRPDFAGVLMPKRESPHLRGLPDWLASELPAPDKDPARRLPPVAKAA